MLLQAPGNMKSDNKMDDSARTIPDPGMKYDPEGGFQKHPDQVLDKPEYVGEHSAITGANLMLLLNRMNRSELGCCGLVLPQPENAYLGTPFITFHTREQGNNVLTLAVLHCRQGRVVPHR